MKNTNAFTVSLMVLIAFMMVTLSIFVPWFVCLLVPAVACGYMGYWLVKNRGDEECGKKTVKFWSVATLVVGCAAWIVAFTVSMIAGQK